MDGAQQNGLTLEPLGDYHARFIARLSNYSNCRPEGT